MFSNIGSTTKRVSEESGYNLNETSALLSNGKSNNYYYQHDYESNITNITNVTIDDIVNKEQFDQQQLNNNISHLKSTYHTYTRYIIWSIIISITMLSIVLLSIHNQNIDIINTTTTQQSTQSSHSNTYNNK